MNEELLGTQVRLRLLRPDDHEALCSIGLDERLWRLTATKLRTPEDMADWIAVALREHAAGTALPFVIVERTSGSVVGSTRFFNLDPRNRKTELGWTWIAPPWQRTAINTEAKFLLLRHAFEKLGCVRVQFKINATNDVSRRSLIRLGAVEEGTLRAFQLGSGGVLCDMSHFSILATEWPSIKARLEARLQGSEKG